MHSPHADISNELPSSHPRYDVDIAFKTIYLHIFSYAGTGTLFKRFYSRVNVPPMKTNHFLKLKKWIVKNVDFRFSR